MIFTASLRRLEKNREKRLPLPSASLRPRSRGVREAVDVRARGDYALLLDAQHVRRADGRERVYAHGRRTVDVEYLALAGRVVQARLRVVGVEAVQTSTCGTTWSAGSERAGRRGKNEIKLKLTEDNKVLGVGDGHRPRGSLAARERRVVVRAVRRERRRRSRVRLVIRLQQHKERKFSHTVTPSASRKHRPSRSVSSPCSGSPR